MSERLLFICTLVPLAGVLLVWTALQRPRLREGISLALVLASSLTHQRLYNLVAEDAFITLRYAQNLAQGRGAVFNPGEHVEGYSNFLWMVLLAALHWALGLDLVELARSLGQAAALGTVVAAWWVTRRVTAGRADLSLLAAMAVAFSGSVAAYGPSGLETPLFALLLLLALGLVLGGALRGGGLVAALATMTRPDGSLVLAALLLWLLLRRAPTHKQRLLYAARFALPAAALLLPWTCWRLWYYGYLIPNSVAAKMGADLGTRLDWGASYLWTFVVTNPLPLVLLAVAALALARRDRLEHQRQDYLLVGLPLLLTLYVVLVGGDWMPAWRYLVPSIPLGVVAACRAWHVAHPPAHAQPLGRASPGQLALLLLACVLCVLQLGLSEFHPNLRPAVKRWQLQLKAATAVGRWFRRSLPPGTLIATYANGALSYHAGAGLRIIGTLGLTDEHIARRGKKSPSLGPGHMAGDKFYVIGRRPALVFHSGGTTKPGPDCRYAPEYLEQYDPVAFRFTRGQSDLGDYITLLVLRQRRQALVRQLTRDPGVVVTDGCDGK